MANSDGTRGFCNVLRYCAMDKHILDLECLLQLSKSSKPYNPMLACLPKGSSDDKFAMEQAFEQCLGSGVNWPEITSEAARIGRDLAVEHERQRRAMSATRLFAMPDRPWIHRWVNSWSSRNLEQLLTFFTHDGVYKSHILPDPIRGRVELRRFFGAFFHASHLTLTLGEALTDGKSEVVLRWEKSGRRSFGAEVPQVTGISFRGKSKLKIRAGSPFEDVQGKICRCTETWNIRDFGRLAIASTVSRGTLQIAHIQVTENEVIFPSGLRVPRKAPISKWS
jgi:hypothetical protein